MTAPFPGVLEIAPGADRTADPAGYTYTAITADVAQSEMVINRGRRSGPGAVAEPNESGVLLTNDGRYTEGKATGTYYPYVRRGLVVRHSINEGARYLGLTGATNARASTPDAASLDITGDLFLAVEFRSPIIVPTLTESRFQVLAKYNSGSNQRSYYFSIDHNGALVFFWSTTGSDALPFASTLPIPCPDQGPLSVGLYLDVDGGATNHIVYAWSYHGTVPDMRTALAANERVHRLGDPDTNSGTTSIFNSTAPLEIGDITGTGDLPYPGGINRVEVRAGNWTGTVAANPDFTIQTVGAGSFADTAAAPKTWTVTAPAAISDRKTRFMGELTSNQLLLPGHGVPGTAQAQWGISGLLQRLRKGGRDDRALESALFQRITSPENADVVDGYWPMEDGRDSTQFFTPIAGQFPIQKINGMSLASDDSLPASKPLPTVSGNDDWWFDVQVPTSTSGTWELSWLVNIPTPSAAPARIMNIWASGSAHVWIIQQDSTNVTISALDSIGGGLMLDTMGWNTAFQHWSILRMEAAQNGGNIDYALTWIPLFGPGAGGGSVISGSFAATAGRVTRFAKTVTSVAPPDGLSMGHVALTSGTVNSWLAGADQAYKGEACAARAFRICKEQGIRVLVDGAYSQSNSPANVAAGEQTMGPQPITTVADALEVCALVANGFLGDATETLALTFRSGWTLNNQTAALTLGNAKVQPYAPVSDDRDIVNAATVTRPAGSSAKVVDTDHQALEGAYPDSRSRNVEFDERLQDHAGWWVHESTHDEARLPGLSWELAKDSTLEDPTLATSRGDLLHVTSLPAACRESTTDQLLDGVTETIGATHWRIEANVRPARPFITHVLDDDTLGKLDTWDSNLAALIDDNDTSLSVVSDAGTLWDPADAEDGFTIEIGGEQMTVTDISGTTSPQTFTVVRSVNGVVKGHAADAVVRLWQPAVLAL